MNRIGILRTGEGICALVLMAFFLVALHGAFQLRPAPGLFPRIVGLAGLVFAAVVAAQLVLGGAHARAEPPPAPLSLRRDIVALLAAPGYGAVFHVFGFYIAAGVGILTLPWLLGYRRPLFLLALAVGMVAALHFIFTTTLNVPVPLGIVGNWFMRRFVYLD